MRVRVRVRERARSEGSRVIEEIAELANLSILTTIPILLQLTQETVVTKRAIEPSFI